jgi:diguanylate cyclase (GGDEF)-like protein
MNVMTTPTQTFQNTLFAAALVLLTTLAGVMAGGPWVPLLLLSLVFTGLGLWFARQDWLAKPAEDAPPSERIRGMLVIAGAFLISLTYVSLTGGDTSRLAFARYLPVVLAAICFGPRAGIVTGLSMAFVYVVGQGWHDPHHALMAVDWEGAIGFLLVAMGVSLLTKRNEERLIALHHHARDLDALLDMSQMMNSAINLETTLNLILLNVQKLSDCPVCAIYLKGVSQEHLELRAATVPRDRIFLRPSLPLAEIAQSELSTLRLDEQARSSICLPLTCVEGEVGLLYVSSDAPYALRSADVGRLVQLASRAAFPIQRALAQQDIETLAYSDAMTGLDNFRQFERLLRDETDRAQRYGRPMSLLMLDIDHFKAFNDTMGHQAGDALLAQLGAVLRNALRSVDRPARYGGEEFAVILPETGSDEASLIAERVRHAVAEAAFFLTGQDSPATHVTVSVGFATCFQDACSDVDLLRCADTALYAAKRSGRNAVRGYAEASVPALAA